MLKLVEEMIYRLDVRGPLDSTKGSPLGERQYWEMTSGTLEGPRIRAKVAMPGGDWMHVSPDGFWRPDVRLQFVTDDGATVLLHYTGLVQQAEAFIRAASEGSATDWADVNMRMAMRFDTGAAKYRVAQSQPVPCRRPPRREERAGISGVSRGVASHGRRRRARCGACRRTISCG